MYTFQLLNNTIFLSQNILYNCRPCRGVPSVPTHNVIPSSAVLLEFSLVRISYLSKSINYTAISLLWKTGFFFSKEITRIQDCHLWFCESQTYKYLDFLLTGSRILAGPSSLRVLSDPWFCESQTYKYLGFPSSGSTFYTIFRTDFPRTTSPIKAYTWVDCGHNPPFSTIMKVGGGTTVYTCGRCIVFTPVTFWP
jgi:hypothetical protein